MFLALRSTMSTVIWPRTSLTAILEHQCWLSACKSGLKQVLAERRHGQPVLDSSIASWKRARRYPFNPNGSPEGVVGLCSRWV